MENVVLNSHILKSYSLMGDNIGHKLSEEEISIEIKSDNLAWVHLDANHYRTQSWLTEQCYYLDDIIINALLAEETRPRMSQIGNGIFLILRCVNLNENSDPEDMISIRMWIDPYRVISIQKRNTKSINDIENSIISGDAPKNSGDFLCLLLSNVFRRMEPTLGLLDSVMDDVEEDLMENPTNDLRGQLVHIRKQAIIFRRYMLPQRDALSNLRNIDLEWINEVQKRRLQENYDHTMRYIEDLESVRERSQIIKDELSNVLADRMNKNMYILSVIASIFLPLGFLTGLLGVNVGGIPGSENQFSFYIFTFILCILVAIQVLLFRKWRWF